MLQTLLAVSIVLSAQPASTSAGSEEAAVQKAFASYREAVLAKDGQAAAGTLDEETIQYYARSRDSALNDGEEKLKKEPFFFRMMVLRLRKDLDAELLQKLDGRQLLALSVDKGWISASSVEKARLGKVSINGDRATSEVFSGEQKVPFEFAFKREAQGWRFSLLPLLAFSEPAMKELAKRAEKTEDELIFAMLEQVSGEAPSNDLWKPLLPPPEKEADATVVPATASAGPQGRVVAAFGGKAFIFKRTDGKARTFNAATTCPEVKKDDEVTFLEGGPDVECEKAAFEIRRTKSVCQVVCRKLVP